jgi:hypothetical protein
MQVKDLLGFGAVVVGGYFLLKEVFGIDVLASLGIGTPVAPTQTTPQVTDPTVVAAANTKSQVLAAMVAGGFDASKYHTVSEYNWFYSKVRGIPGPSNLIPGDTGSTLYSFDEWWTALVGAGFSGLGTIGHNSPIANRWTCPDLTKWERMSKRFN